MTVHWYAGGQAFAQQGARDRRAGDQATRRRCSASPRPSRSTSSSTATRRRSATALGPGTRENVGGQAHADIRTLFALITPDEIDEPWVGVVDPARARPPRVRHRRRQPVPVPAALAQRGPRGLPLGGLRARATGAACEDAVVEGRADPAASRSAASSRPTPTRRSSPTPSPCRRSTTSSARRARTRWSRLVDAYADGLTDDEAFTKALGQDLAAFQAGWLADLGAPTPEAVRPAAGTRRARCRPGWTGPAPTPGRPPADARRRRRPRPRATRRARRPGDAGAGGRRAGIRLRIAPVRWSSALVVVVRRRDRRRWSSRRRADRRGVSALAPRVRAIPTWQVTLGARAPRARVPDRRAARVRGPADPVSRARSGRRWSRPPSTSRRSRTASSSRSSTCGRRSRTSRRPARAARR